MVDNINKKSVAKMSVGDTPYPHISNKSNRIIRLDFKSGYGNDVNYFTKQYPYDNIFSGPSQLEDKGCTHIFGVALDKSGNVYVSDPVQNVILKITGAGEVIPWAGQSGKGGRNDGGVHGSEALFFLPKGIDMDNSGNLYVADSGNNQIRMITPDRMVYTIAGSKTGESGFANGFGSNALFDNPIDIAINNSGDIFVVDRDNHAIRKIKSGVSQVNTVVGDGIAGDSYGIGVNSRIRYPSCAACTPSGDILIGDNGNHKIKRIDGNFNLLKYSGSGIRGHLVGGPSECRYNNMISATVDASGNLYVTDVMENGQHYVLKVDTYGKMSEQTDFRTRTEDPVDYEILSFGIATNYEAEVFVTESYIGVQPNYLTVRLYDRCDNLIGEFLSNPYFDPTDEPIDILFTGAQYSDATVYDLDMRARNDISPPCCNYQITVNTESSKNEPVSVKYAWNDSYNLGFEPYASVLNEELASTNVVSEPLCKVVWPEDDTLHDIERLDSSGNFLRFVKYQAELPRPIQPAIRYNVIGSKDGLGDGGTIQTDIFVFHVENGSTVMRVTTKAGPNETTIRMDGVGDSVLTDLGFRVVLLSIVDGVYTVSVTSESNRRALSYVDFNPCEADLLRERWIASEFFMSHKLLSVRMQIGPK